VVLAIFVAGLMVGPERQSMSQEERGREVKMAMLAFLVLAQD